MKLTLNDLFQCVEVNEIHLFAVCFKHGFGIGCPLRFRHLLYHFVEHRHHEAMFEAQLIVIDGTAKVEYLLIVVEIGWYCTKIPQPKPSPKLRMIVSALSMVALTIRCLGF